MFRIKVISIIFFAFIANYSSYGQNPYMWHITDDDGLPSMEVYNMLQDKKGFIWFGTDNGVCKYDGHQFTNYYNAKQRGKSFSYFDEDNNGRIWCINFAGQIFYIENDSLKLFEPFEKVYKTGFPRFCFDNKNQLWIVSNNNPVYYYNFQKQKLSYIKGSKSILNQNIISDKKGNLLFSADYLGMIIGDSIVKISDTSYNSKYSKQEDKFYLLDKKLNIGEIEWPIKYNRKLLNKDALKNANEKFIDFISFNQNDRWCLTYDGVYSFTANKQASCLNAHILKGNAVSGVMKDREGNYWFSTLKNGVFVMPSRHVWVMNKENSSLITSRISKMAEDKNGQIYLGTGFGNIAVFNPESKKIIETIHIEKEEKDFDAINIDKTNNKIYLQSSSSLIYDLIKKKSIYRFYNFSSIKNFSVDPFGNFLIAASGSASFVILNEKGKQSPFYKQYLFTKNKDANKLSNTTFLSYVLRNQRSVSSFINDRDTTLWVAYIDGLYYYKNGKEYVLKDKNNHNIFATAFSLGNDKNIWVTTVQQGVLAIKDQKIVEHLTTKDGLKSDFTRCIAANSNTVWIGTEKGVQGYNVSSKKWQSFTKEDGLITNDVLGILVKNDYIYLATSKGFQWFNEKKLIKNEVPPKIYIQNVLVNEKPTELEKNYQFNYTQNNIGFQFTGIAFTSRKSMQFAYRLIGLDTTWKFISSQERMVRFNTLSSGNYLFQLKALNEDGIESDTVEQISFVVAPPYWQKWWFVTLLVLLFTLLISAGFFIRINSLNRQNKLKQEKSQLEIDLRSSQLSALKMQMNPHFIFNALNSIQEYILTNEKKLANTYLGKFSDLMRLYLDMSNKNSISLEEEIKAMELYLELESLRFEDSFEFELKVSPLLQTYDIMIPSMIIQPYIENAVKHGLFHKKNDRKLSISFIPCDEKVITCEIIDNGIGRQKSYELNAFRSKKHASFATNATLKRLTLLNVEANNKIAVVYDDLKFNDGTPMGTKVVITIPYNT